MSFLYFSLEYAIIVHDYIISHSGGFKGIKDRGLLASTLEFVKNDNYYPNIEDKATYLFFSLIKNHAFNDGNKRSSIALTAFFFELNNMDHLISRFMNDMENLAVDIADNRISRDLLYEIMESFIYEDELSDELKIKIINAKQNIDR